MQCLKRELKSRVYEVNTFKKNGEIKTSDTFRDYYKALQFYDSLSDEKSKEFVEIHEDESGFDFDTIKERIVL